MHTECYSETLKRRDHLRDLGIDGKIVSDWTSKKQDIRVWTGFIWIRI